MYVHPAMSKRGWVYEVGRIGCVYFFCQKELNSLYQEPGGEGRGWEGIEEIGVFW